MNALILFLHKSLIVLGLWNEGNFLFWTKHSNFMANYCFSPLRSPEGIECCPGLAVGLTHYQVSVSLL